MLKIDSGGYFKCVLNHCTHQVNLDFISHYLAYLLKERFVNNACTDLHVPPESRKYTQHVAFHAFHVSLKNTYCGISM